MCSTRTRMAERNSKRIVSSAPLAEEACRCAERLLSCVGSVLRTHAHEQIGAQLHMAVGRMQPTLRRLRCVAFLQYQDLFDRDDNTEVQNQIAGRSVACLDRTGWLPFDPIGPSCSFAPSARSQLLCHCQARARTG